MGVQTDLHVADPQQYGDSGEGMMRVSKDPGFWDSREVMTGRGHKELRGLSGKERKGRVVFRLESSLKFRGREEFGGGRSSEGGEVQGEGTSELRLGRMSGVLVRVCTPLFRVEIAKLLGPNMVTGPDSILIMSHVEPELGSFQTRRFAIALSSEKVSSGRSKIRPLLGGEVDQAPPIRACAETRARVPMSQRPKIYDPPSNRLSYSTHYIECVPQSRVFRIDSLCSCMPGPTDETCSCGRSPASMHSQALPRASVCSQTLPSSWELNRTIGQP